MRTWRVFVSEGNGFEGAMTEWVGHDALAVDAGKVVVDPLAFILVDSGIRDGTDHHRLRNDQDPTTHDRGELALEHGARTLHVPPVGDEVDARKAQELPIDDDTAYGLGVRERTTSRVVGREGRMDACRPCTSLETENLRTAEGVTRDEERNLESTGEIDRVVDATGRNSVTLVMGTAEHRDSSLWHVSSGMGSDPTRKIYWSGFASKKFYM